MSETIEERGQYCLEQVSAGIAIIEERLTANGGVLFKLDLLVKLKGLLDDLMAERGKKVNLDEIFPKEVMEKAERFYVKPSRDNTSAILYPGLFTACVKSYGVYGNGEYIVQALDDDIPRGINLATRRVLLGLTVEIVEDK